MKQHEREFFISVLRSGNKYLKLGNIRLCVKPMTYMQCIESNDRGRIFRDDETNWNLDKF